MWANLFFWHKGDSKRVGKGLRMGDSAFGQSIGNDFKNFEFGIRRQNKSKFARLITDQCIFLMNF